RQTALPPRRGIRGSIEEIVLIIGGEVGLGRCLAAQGLTGTDELQVIQAAGMPLLPLELKRKS
ncbi:hypothetical protein EVA_22646, partial [gut metagenome]